MPFLMRHTRHHHSHYALRYYADYHFHFMLIYFMLAPLMLTLRAIICHFAIIWLMLRALSFHRVAASMPCLTLFLLMPLISLRAISQV